MLNSLLALLRQCYASYLGREHRRPDRFERSPEFAGATVIPCDLGSKGGDGPLLYWVVYPLANAKDEHGQAQQQQVALWQKLNRCRDTGHHAGPSDQHDGVPPVFKLQPGEKITHMLLPMPDWLVDQALAILADYRGRSRGAADPG